MDARRNRLFLSAMALWISTACAAASAHSAPWENSGRIDRAIGKYSRSRVETLTGTVVKVYENVPSFGKKRNDALGYHMILDTGKEKVDLHLGPAWFLKGIEGMFGVGDAVEVVGSVDEPHPPEEGKVPMKEMRAAEIRKGGAVVLKLRDEEGRPAWSGH